MKIEILCHYRAVLQFMPCGSLLKHEFHVNRFKFCTYFFFLLITAIWNLNAHKNISVAISSQNGTVICYLIINEILDSLNFLSLIDDLFILFSCLFAPKIFLETTSVQIESHHILHLTMTIEQDTCAHPSLNMMSIFSLFS